MLWVLNGVVYVILLFATGLWQRIIPTSWDVFPEAIETLGVYLSLQVPPIEHFQPYDALQPLGYAFVIFILAPFMILTGIAMSPAIRSRFPWFVKLWGGHQAARSLHFIGMVLMSGFIIMHVALVFLVHPEHNLAHIVFGDTGTARFAQALVIVIATVVAVVVFWTALSYWTLANRVRAHDFLEWFTELGRKVFLNGLKPRMRAQSSYTDDDLSEFHWTNGLPPTAEESADWVAARERDWQGYTITLGDDLGGRAMDVGLDELRALPQTSYVAVHTCMQGWSATSRWTGVRLKDALALLGPRPDGARYVLIDSYGLAQKMYHNRPCEPFYSVIDLAALDEEDTILAYERNGHPIELHLGAPARVRVESQHGYKMVKWVRSIRWIADYAEYGDGRDGTREDSALQTFNGRI